MALDPPNNKRKRGRPAHASKPEAHASQEPSAAAEEYDGEGDDAGRPKKRGRPRRQLAKPAAGEKLAREDHDGKEAPEPRTRRKRGRPSLSNNIADAASAKEPRRAGPQERLRRRKHDKDQRQEVGGEEPGPSVRRTRGRPAAQQQDARVRKRDVPPPEEEARPTRKDARRTKPLVNGDAGPRREKRRGGDGRESAAEAAAEADVETDKRKHRRRRGGDGDGDDEDAPPSPPPRPYPHIAPQVHRVRKSTIEARWSPLGESSLAAMSSMLRLAHRPILQRLSNTQQRREHTSSALHLIGNRITRRITKGLPFPPPSMTGSGGTRRRKSAAMTSHRSIKDSLDDGRAAELEFESVLDAKQALERQLDPALHAVELLTREKERLERELERDYEALRNLESSARAEAREHRGLLRKAHVLAPMPDSRRAFDPSSSSLSSQALSSDNSLFDNLQEDEADIKALGLQLGSHAESIANNLGQTEGILTQMARGRAALQEVLVRYLDEEQYESVLLGRHS